MFLYEQRSPLTILASPPAAVGFPSPTNQGLSILDLTRHIIISEASFQEDIDGVKNIF